MKTTTLSFIIGLFIISNSSYAQWSGSTSIDGNIYRNAGISIGTNLYNGHISFGEMGTHLSIARSGFLSQVILATGWTGINGDYTELRVPGAIQNPGMIRLQGNGFVGIGTQVMYERFQIGSRFLFHDGGSKKITYNSYYDQNMAVIKRVDAAPVAEMSYNADGSIHFLTAPTGAANSIVDNATLAMMITNSGNIGIGTINPGSFKLAVEGNIGARGIRVTLANPFPDYVFDSTYQLRTLATLQQYIDKNKHLPGIPSEQEVKKDGGIELGEMNVKLLEKVEELTLYILELNKKLEAQQNKLEGQQKEIDRLKNQIN
jgi:hypothetical protein